MFAYLKTLSPADRAQEIAAIEQVLQRDPTALVHLYRDAAMQQTSRNASQSMVLSITGISIGAILAGAFVGFPLALTAGTLFLAQQFWNSQKQKQTARWAIEDGEDFTRFLDRDTQREYKHFAAAVKETSGHVLPHSEPVIEVPIDKGQQLNTTIVWDEFGGYDQFHDLEALGTSLRSLLREATKHGYFPVLVAHGDQANFYPGVKGILGTLKEATVKVETIGKQLDAYGTMAPTGRVIVTWLDGKTSEIQLPDWLTVELLLSLQPTHTRPALLNAMVLNRLPLPAVPTAVPETKPPQPAEQFIGEADSDQKAIEQKQRIQKKLAEKLKVSGAEWVNIRDLTTNLFSRSEDRELAKSLLASLLKAGRLEGQPKENANKTRSLLVRAKPKV